jgi:hypothetical protein
MKIKAIVDGLELELTIPDETFRSEKYPEGGVRDGCMLEVADFEVCVRRFLELLLAEKILPMSVTIKGKIEKRMDDAHCHAKSIESARRLAYLGT